MNKPQAGRHLPHKHKNLSSDLMQKKKKKARFGSVCLCVSVSPVLGKQRQARGFLASLAK